MMSKDLHPRRPVYAPRGAVATTQPLAASAGLAVLRRGGNAVDAAIATAAALTVLQPGSNDIGSDLFALVWDGSAAARPERLRPLAGALTRDLVLSASRRRASPVARSAARRPARPGSCRPAAGCR